MSRDTELLRRYVEHRSEAAFAELVQLHLNLVYFAALRQMNGDAHRAEEVTQAVFTDLARKAAVLRGHATLTGWLHTSTRFAAAKARRAEFARQKREHEFETMQTVLSDDSASAADWEKLRPMIDDVVHELGERDREVVLLRFFEGRAFAEIGAALGLSEDAARMRVERALAKLRAALARRGVASTTSALALVFAHQAGASAPANVLAGVTSAALAGAGGTVTTGSFAAMTGIKLFAAAAVLVGAAVYVARREPAATPNFPASKHASIAVTPTDVEATRSTAPAITTEPAPEAARPERIEWRAPAELTRAGRATPRAAFEQLLFAMVEGDLDAIAAGIVLGPVGRARAEGALARLPEEGRLKFSPAEKFIALKIATDTHAMLPRVAAIKVLAQTETAAGQAALRVQMREISGLVREEELLFERAADGWRLLLPEKQ